MSAIEQSDSAIVRRALATALQRHLGDAEDVRISPLTFPHNGLSNETAFFDAAWEQGDAVQAHAWWSDALRLALQNGDQGLSAITLGDLGMMAFHEGDYATASGQIEESSRHSLGDVTIRELLDQGRRG